MIKCVTYLIFKRPLTKATVGTYSVSITITVCDGNNQLLLLILRMMLKWGNSASGKPESISLWRGRKWREKSQRTIEGEDPFAPVSLRVPATCYNEVRWVDKRLKNGLSKQERNSEFCVRCSSVVKTCVANLAYLCSVLIGSNYDTFYFDGAGYSEVHTVFCKNNRDSERGMPCIKNARYTERRSRRNKLSKNQARI